MLSISRFCKKSSKTDRRSEELSTSGSSLAAAFGAAGAAGRWFSLDADGRLRLDLWAANRDQLLEAGLSAEHVHLARLCTASHPDLFPSYRRDGPGTGRVAAVIRAGLVGPPPQE